MTRILAPFCKNKEEYEDGLFFYHQTSIASWKAITVAFRRPCRNLFTHFLNMLQRNVKTRQFIPQLNRYLEEISLKTGVCDHHLCFKDKLLSDGHTVCNKKYAYFRVWNRPLNYTTFSMGITLKSRKKQLTHVKNQYIPDLNEQLIF